MEQRQGSCDLGTYFKVPRSLQKPFAKRAACVSELRAGMKPSGINGIHIDMDAPSCPPSAILLSWILSGSRVRASAHTYIRAATVMETPCSEPRGGYVCLPPRCLYRSQDAIEQHQKAKRVKNRSRYLLPSV